MSIYVVYIRSAGFRKWYIYEYRQVMDAGSTPC